MKHRIEELLHGEFKFGGPKLIFSQERIIATLKAGDALRGELKVTTEENARIRGYITSTDRRMVPGFRTFQGTQVQIPYGIDAKGLNAGEERRGYLIFTTNLGEERIPFEIHTVSAEGVSYDTSIRTLKDFAALARENFREAYRIFSGGGFERFIDRNDEKSRSLLAGFMAQPITNQHLEEFLIAEKLKDPIKIFLDEDKREYHLVQDYLREELKVRRSTWGHIRLEVSATADFIDIEKRVLTEEDFYGTIGTLSFVIRPDRLDEDNRYGQIRIRSPYEEVYLTVIASRGPRVNVDVRTGEKKRRLELLKDYLDYRCHDTDFSTWAGSAHYILNCLKESGFDYPEYRLYEAFVLHEEDRDEEAQQILKAFQDKAFQKEDIELAGAYLYLCTVTGIYTDVEAAIRRMNSFYIQKQNSLLLFELLYSLDLSLQDEWEETVSECEALYERGVCSPFLYLRAFEMVRQDMGLLHRLSPFWVQVFYFAARRGMLNEELVMRIAYLSGYERHFQEGLLRILEQGYALYNSRDTLEAICRYIILGNPRRPEFFKWYALAIREDIHLTRLYEYYLETLDITYHQELPKSLMVYFTYNNRSLGDNRKAYLYANVLAEKDRYPEDYEKYRPNMIPFARRKLREGRINEDFAALYQEFIIHPQDREEAAALAGLVFMERIFCETRVRSVIVRHRQLNREDIYSCAGGVAYVRVYTPDAAILFQDDKQRRYGATIGYNCKKLFDERRYMQDILDAGVADSGLLLNYAVTNPITWENVDLFRQVASSDTFSDEYRNEIRIRLLNFYKSHVHGKELDDYLKNLDIRSYAQADRKSLLELLVARGFFTQAYSIIEEFGYEGISLEALQRLGSRMIQRREMAEDQELLALSDEVYRHGIYDDTILKYLMRYRYGSLDSLLSIYESAKEFGLDTYDLEERILSLIMFTRQYVNAGERVLSTYLEKNGDKTVVGAYLTHVSYLVFVKGMEMTPYIRKCLKKAFEEGWPGDRVCHLALLQELSHDEDQTKDLPMKKALLAESVRDNLIFTFYKLLPREILEPYQLDDKEFVELHTAPEAKVLLYYSQDDEGREKTPMRVVPLQAVYEGIFVKAFTLFYGETLRYYFQTENEGQTMRTEERTLIMTELSEEPVSKYQLLNQIFALKREGRTQDMLGHIREYLRREKAVDELFVLEDREESESS